ncbi:MAG: class I SAM-dependent methyltransferase [Rubrivivax sp.]|nr:class I SAM-dependent methyltransferase [Rubrivivax sp.]
MSSSPEVRPAAPAVLPPHRPLPAYYNPDEKDQRRSFLRHIFDETAGDYDRIEGVLAFGSGPWYRRQALVRAGLGAGMQVVDVGCGTGLLAREAVSLVGPAGALTGVDPSPGMMAQVGARGPLPGARFIEGRAEALPLPDASADFVSMGYALRHIDDVAVAFAEFRRVLRPGGRVLVLEITRPQGAFARFWLRLYMRFVVPLLARLLARHGDTPQLFRYYWDTIEACITPPEVMSALERAGFVDVRRHVELGIFSEYTGTVPAH